MLFNSVSFLIFFPIVVLIYFIVPKKLRYIWLLISSYYFYMSWNAKYALLILFSTATTWALSLAINKAGKKSVKKLALAVCIIANLAILFTYKYLNFFIASANTVLGSFGLQIIDRQFDLLLPVGISFYTFQALGYIIDVYREDIVPEKSPLRYALFVSFFPQLVAGPIERSKNLLSQMQNIENLKLWNYSNITQGLSTMVWGMFIKMVIADRVAILVNTVFNDYYMLGSFGLIAGAVGFALQIYCDFMGYSTIAVGAAKVMGFDIMENFNTPYLSRSVSEFWRRWHISLSTWFRDYVYIPLGGSRCSKPRKYFNLLVTFAVSGLWHGANWTFLVWGLINGIFQVIADITLPFRNKINSILNTKTDSFSYKLWQTVFTFICIDFAWIFFRADTIAIALEYCTRLFTKWDPWSLFTGELYTLGLDRFEFNVLIVAVIVLVALDFIRYFKKQSFSEFLGQQCLWFRWAMLICLILSCIVYGIYGVQFDSSQFIYFQF